MVISMQNIPLKLLFNNNYSLMEYYVTYAINHLQLFNKVSEHKMCPVFFFFCEEFITPLSIVNLLSQYTLSKGSRFQVHNLVRMDIFKCSYLPQSLGWNNFENKDKFLWCPLK